MSEVEKLARDLQTAHLRANGAGPNDLREALERHRVNLIALIRHGIPRREYVPGCHGRFAKSKRHHLAAERKTGKSLALGVVDALDVIAAGGTIVVLDRENGQDEYARRLDEVLRARDADHAQVEERFRYYAWPQLKLEWGKNTAYPHLFDGADLVIFDSSRKFLTSVGLKEDLSDDFSRFTEELIDPLSRAGIATLILDNTGHDNKERSRGSSSKGDLADVTFTLKKTTPFTSDKAGALELTCHESRFGDIHGRWVMELGGGQYGSWQRPEEDGRETFRTAVVEALVEEAPKGRDALIKEARRKGAKGDDKALRTWLAELAAEPAAGFSKTTAGYVPEGWVESATQGPPTPPVGPLGGAPKRDEVPGGPPTPGWNAAPAPPNEDRFADWQPYPTPSKPEDDEPPERKDLA